MWCQDLGNLSQLVTRFDANVRPYWLRDWQSGFGGYTKVYEYQVQGQTMRQYSVAHVVRPRTPTTDACLCFTLMSKLPDKKVWKRSTGQRDPSRSTILDLQEAHNWRMSATVLTPCENIAATLDDNTQVQWLPVSKSDYPKWTCRKVPKVTSFRNFGRIPLWCRRPQEMTYRLCIVQSLPDEEKDDLLSRGILPHESSARDRHCVM